VTPVAPTASHLRVAGLCVRVLTFSVGIAAVAGCGQPGGSAATPNPPLPSVASSTLVGPEDAGTGDLPGAVTAPPVSSAPPGGTDGGTSSCRADSPWQNIDAGEFSFTLPCDMAQKPVHGIDSKVASYESPSISLMYDYGRYSSNLGELEGQPELREESATIGGKPARIVTVRTADAASARPFTAAVAFASVGPAIRADKIRLTMVARGKTAADQDTAKRIFRSIQFK
jgi:hypothetical protein